MSQRFLLPRLVASANLRKSLKLHQLGLLKRFNERLVGLQAQQEEARRVLPSPALFKEESQYATCKDLDSLSIKSDAPISVPPASFLRCALADKTVDNKTTAEDLFNKLEARYSWLKSDEGLQYEVRVVTSSVADVYKLELDYIMGNFTKRAMFHVN